MLSRLCRVPLDPARPDFTLARIPKSSRLAELEFHLPAERLDARALLAAIRNPHAHASSTGLKPVGSSAGFQPAENLGDAAAFADRQDACPTTNRLEACAATARWLDDGFLKGFMDLVFAFEGRYFILDWKSNRLGNRLADYSQEAMGRAIRHSLYDLQYHLYTVALDRFLRVRLPDYDYEKHFGGVIYVFLRGVTQDDPTLGVFRDRPSAETIQRLKQAMRHGD
jgi:ATP-dependent exoDNAse (exonuclease V) beta subunit